MSNFKRAAPGRSILSTLQATTMLDSKPALPAEILATILDYLPVADLMRFAQTSRRMREMVYDDTRWVPRLKSMGLWNEAEARQRFDDAMKRRRQTLNGVPGASPTTAQPIDTTIFDAQEEEDRRRKAAEDAAKAPAPTVDGFETLTLNAAAQPNSPYDDPDALLDILKSVKSIRGRARQEYGRVYGALAPFYYDLAQAKSHTEPVVFQAFRDPERQARMLNNLFTFAKSDWAQGWNEREEKLITMTSMFESAVLREFEQGYEFWDVEGRMKRYAHVLHFLNGGSAAMELFVSKHPLLSDRDVLANSMDCINQGSYEEITLEPSRQFFQTLASKSNEQSAIINQIFPVPSTAFWYFMDKLREEVIIDYVTSLLDELHRKNKASYLKAVSGLFEQCLAFSRSLRPPTGTPEELEEHAKELALHVFEQHLDLYLQDELDHFTQHAEREVANWDQRLSEQDLTAESFYMSNFNRRADKNDFLSSFRKVVMMPVTVLGGTSKPVTTPAVNRASLQQNGTLTPGSRPGTPGLGNPLERKSTPLPPEAPTDELKAKAALMANRLEGIKSLCSIEVALDLVQAAKISLGRAAMFVSLGGQAGGEAKEQCEAIFIALLKTLGQTHVKYGFIKAVDHLSLYNPREVSDHSQTGVAPLVTFIELVNVGDLISQMVDVFYEQQLAAPKIADRNDFLDPAGLAKKKFEQMLDESVAAGLNKGIDVLMDEVEYLCATTQSPTDYNPQPASEEKGASSQDFDIGPTQTALRIKELVSSHTNMLVGSTEKTMLDVFNGEVGLRLFTAICKHLKRQRISTEGAIKLIADMNLYFEYIRTLKNPDLLAYFKALRELSQIYLIDGKHAKEMATVIADGDKFGGIFRAEEVYEYAQRRSDWYQIKRDVERAMYGLECSVM
ncbi:F-box protein: endocytic membrane traffic, recycling ReCYcling 1 [Pestalotiopsis sp. 9143b]|nr:F-box protein: endocytic membrane traffic, recycling ReCYcling 1 [Pestalotiopsis sp. 9143b]